MDEGTLGATTKKMIGTGQRFIFIYAPDWSYACTVCNVACRIKAMLPPINLMKAAPPGKTIARGEKKGYAPTLSRIEDVLRENPDELGP